MNYEEAYDFCYRVPIPSGCEKPVDSRDGAKTLPRSHCDKLAAFAVRDFGDLQGFVRDRRENARQTDILNLTLHRVGLGSPF